MLVKSPKVMTMNTSVGSPAGKRDAEAACVSCEQRVRSAAALERLLAPGGPVPPGSSARRAVEGARPPDKLQLAPHLRAHTGISAREPMGAQHNAELSGHLRTVPPRQPQLPAATMMGTRPWTAGMPRVRSHAVWFSHALMQRRLHLASDDPYVQATMAAAVAVLFQDD
jgi:hypothetical protein